MQRAWILILPLLILLGGVSFGQMAPAPIPVKVEIPQIDWGGMIRNIMGSVHPAMVVAIGFFISIWAYSFIATMFKGFANMGSGSSEESRFKQRYEAGQRYREYADGRSRNARGRSAVDGVEWREQSRREQEENDRRRDEAYEQYHDAAFWDDYREGRI